MSWLTSLGRGWVVLLPLISALLAPPLHEAAADANWKTNSGVWLQRDRCTRAAFKQYPDYTRESNAKREAARLACLRASNLPAEGAPPPAEQSTATQSPR